MGNKNKSKAVPAPKPAPTEQNQGKRSNSNSAPTKPSQPPVKRARFESGSTQTTTANTQSSSSSSTRVKKPPAPAKPPVAPTRPIALAAPSTFTVSVGTYERLLYGLSCHFEPSRQLSITPIFSFPAHLSSLRAVGSSLLPSPTTGSERKVGGKLLVSGGTDEVIKVWDLRRRKEIGILEAGEMSGTITSLNFVPERNMLIASTTDSTIALYRVRDWVLLRALKGHKGRVNSVDPHPAGRVALSVGQDKMLRMWDLVAGKAVATMKIGTEGDVVKWNTDGTKFAVICNNNLTVYGIDMNVLHSLVAPSRFHDVKFTYFPLDQPSSSSPDSKSGTDDQKEWMLVACEDGQTRVFDITNPSVPEPNSSDDDEELEEEKEETTLAPRAVLKGHTNRVKQIDLLEVALPSPTSEADDGQSSSTMIVTTISSDGQILFFDLAQLPINDDNDDVVEGGVKEIEPIGRFGTDGSRLTCLSVVGMQPIRKGQEEEEEGDDIENEEGSEEEEDEEDDEEEEEQDESEEDWDGIDEDEDEEEFEGIEEEEE